MKIHIHILALLLLLLSGSATAYAGTITSNATGNWSAGGTRVPAAAYTGTITSGSISSFGLFTFGSGSDAWEVTLVSFTAKRMDNITQLEWITANDVKTNRFVKQRSDDNLNFYSIGEITARNTHNTENYFSHDTRPVNGVAYYRLLSIDNDGKENLSQVITVRANSTTEVLTLGSNAVSDQVILTAAPALNGLFDYRVITMSGQLVQQGKINIHHAGQHELLLKRNILPGTYLLMVNGTDKSFSFKIIKN